MKNTLVLIYFLSCLLPKRKHRDATIQTLKTESSKAIAKDPNDTIPKIWEARGVCLV